MKNLTILVIISSIFTVQLVLGAQVKDYVECVKENKKFRSVGQAIPEGYDNYFMIGRVKSSSYTVNIWGENFVEKMSNEYIDKKCSEKKYQKNYQKIFTCIEDIHNPISFHNQSRLSNYVYSDFFEDKSEIVYLFDENPRISRKMVSDYCDKNFDNKENQNLVKTCTADFDRVLSRHSDSKINYIFSSDDDLFTQCTIPKFRNLISQKLAFDENLSQNKNNAKNKIINNSIMDCYDKQINLSQEYEPMHVPKVLHSLLYQKHSSHILAKISTTPTYNNLLDDNEYNYRALSLAYYAKCKNTKYGQIPLYSYYEDDLFNQCILTRKSNGKDLISSEKFCAEVRNVEEIIKNLQKISDSKMSAEVGIEISDLYNEFLDLLASSGRIITTISNDVFSSFKE